MKNDQMILAAAVGFAALMVAQKKGWLKKSPLSSSVVYPSFQFPSQGAKQDGLLGYNPNDPGAYVTTRDLMAGVSDDEWSYTPTRFEQTIDDALSPDPMAGFWQTGYYRASK